MIISFWRCVGWLYVISPSDKSPKSSEKSESRVYNMALHVCVSFFLSLTLWLMCLSGTLLLQ